MTQIVGGKFRPVSTQIQEDVAADGSSKEILAKMMERGEAVPVESSSDRATTYLTKTPVAYTRVRVNQLSEFDSARKSLKIGYEISTKWPDHFNLNVDCVKLVNLVSPSVNKLSQQMAEPQQRRTDLRNQESTNNPGKWKGEAIVRWEPDLSWFPLDSQALQLLVGFAGEDPLNVILAVDGEAGKHGALPIVAAQFDVAACPTCSDRTYLEVQRKVPLTNPWTGESLNRKNISVYEVQYILRRKAVYSMILMLPLAMAALSWGVLRAGNRPRRFKISVSGVVMFALLAVYGLLVVPYKPPALSLVNGGFVLSGLIMALCLLYAVLTHSTSTLPRAADREGPIETETRAIGNKSNHPAEAPEVFISYASKDAPTADFVSEALEIAGISCSIAPRDVRSGRDYGEVIVSALKGCTVIVVLLSANSNQSEHVKNEVERAVNGRLRIITVRIEDVLPEGSLELHLARSHWLNAFPRDIDEYMGKLVEAIKDPGNSGDPPPPNMRPPRVDTPRGQRLVGVLVSVATVVLLVILLHSLSAMLDPAPTATLVARSAGNPWLFPDSGQRELTDDELRLLSRVGLFWARNEMYARGGFKFSSENGKAYSASLGPEYRGTELIDTKVFDGFNEMEKANVFRIRRYEEMRNSFMPILNPENALFFWHQLRRWLQ